MLTVNQVAERLQISRGSVYALVQRGRLAIHRFGTGRGTIRVSEEDLERYIESCRRELAPEPETRRPRRQAPANLKHIRLSPKDTRSTRAS